MCLGVRSSTLPAFLSFQHGYFSSHHRLVKFFSRLPLSLLLSLSIFVFQLLTLLNKEVTRREAARVPFITTYHQKMQVERFKDILSNFDK